MFEVPLRDRAKGRWPEILQALGLPSDFLRPKRKQPCPLCGGRDRYSFKDKDGSGSFFCNQCGGGFGADLVMKMLRCDFSTAAKQIEAILGHQSPSAAKAIIKQKPIRQPDEGFRQCMRVWHEGKPLVSGDPAWTYLTSRQIDPSAHDLSHLRYHSRLVYTGEDRPQFLPALISAVTSVEGLSVNIHRTYITADGEKAEVESPKRIMQGVLPAGSAIRLGAASDEMGIAEGIETALAASQLSGIPVWAAISAHGLRNWKPPIIARSVIVFGDNDVSNTGQLAAFGLAERLQQSGVSVAVKIPDKVGIDWNDILRGAA